MNVMETVKCAVDGCPVRIVAGAGKFCSRCEAEYEALSVQLEEKRMRELRRNRRFGLGFAERLGVESESAAEAGDPQRRSRLMAELPRVDAGVAELRMVTRAQLWSVGALSFSGGMVAATLGWAFYLLHRGT